MSTSQLYHIQGGRELYFVRYQAIGGADYFYCYILPNYIKCPICKSKNVIKRGIRTRIIKAPPSGQRETFLVIDINRVFCPSCNKVRQVKLKVADPYKSYTKRLGKSILVDTEYMTIKDVSERYKVDFGISYNIMADDLLARYKNIDLSNVTIIAVDEILYKHGHKYLTIVVNYEDNKIIYVAKGKHAGALDDFYVQLTPEGCKRIKAVSMDMSQAYISSVQKNLPNTKIIFDHFHVIKLLNSHLSELRTELSKNMNKQSKKHIFGIRWLLLKNPENLSAGKNEQIRLMNALKENADLATGYYLKEAMRQIWKKEDKNAAKKELEQWIASAQATKIVQLIKMGNTLSKYEEGILNWYDFPISSGPMEGINNKIKVLMRRSYGIRNFNMLKYHLYALHESNLKYNKL